MQNIFYLPIKPLSYNESHTVYNNCLRMSSANSRFKKAVQKLLTPNIGIIKNIAKIKLTKLMGLEVHYIFWIPERELLTLKDMVRRDSLEIGRASCRERV